MAAQAEKARRAAQGAQDAPSSGALSAPSAPASSQVRGKAVPREEWPAGLRRPEIRGVFVGICVSGYGGIAWRRTAHAHTSGEWEGWICFRTDRGLADVDLQRHETAHILAGFGHGHDDTFRRHLTALHGGTLPKDERKIPRQSSSNCRARYHGLCRGKTEARPEGPTTFWYDERGRVSHTTTSKPLPARRCKCWCHEVARG